MASLEEQMALAQSLKDHGNIAPIEPNRAGLAIANLLHGAKGALNWPGKLPKWVPLVGGMGAGDFVLGEGPEYAEDLSYGFGRGRGTGLQRRLDPRAVDLAGTPTFGALTGVKAMANLIRRGAESTFEGAVNAGRRKFLKTAPVAAGGAVVGAEVLPDLARTAIHGAEEAAPVVAREAAPAVARTAAAAVGRFGRHTPAVEAALERMRQNHLLDKDNIDWAIDTYGDEALKQEVREGGLHTHHAAEAEPWLQEDWDNITREEFAQGFEHEIKEAQKLYGDDIDDTWITSNAYGVHDPKARLEKSPHVNVVDEPDYHSMSDMDMIKSQETRNKFAQYFADKGFTHEELQRMNITGRYPPDMPTDPVTINELNQAISDARHAYLRGPNRWKNPMRTDDFWSSLTPEENAPFYEQPKTRDLSNTTPMHDMQGQYAAENFPEVRLTDNEVWSKLTGEKHAAVMKSLPPESPERRGMMQKLGGLLAAGAVTAGGLSGAAKVLKKSTAAAAEHAGTVAKEVAPKVARTTIEHYRPIIEDLVERTRQAHLDQENLHNFEWAIDTWGDDAMKARAHNMEITDADLAQARVWLQEDFKRIEGPKATRELEQHVVPMLEKYGDDIDPSWIQSGSLLEYKSPHFERSPHVNTIDQYLPDGNWVDTSDAKAQLTHWLAEKGYSPQELEKMIVTGRFPPDFPPHEITKNDVYQAFYDRAWDITKNNMDQGVRYKDPISRGDFMRSLTNDEFQDLLQMSQPVGDLNSTLREYAAKYHPQAKFLD